jgi:hypothetical protein
MRTAKESQGAPLDGASQGSNLQPNEQSAQGDQPAADALQTPSKIAPEVKASSPSAAAHKNTHNAGAEHGQKNAKSSSRLPAIYDIFPPESEPLAIARTCEAIAEKTGQSKAAYAIMASLFKSGAPHDAAKISLEHVTLCVKDMLPLWFPSRMFMPTPRRWTLVPEHRDEQHSGHHQHSSQGGSELRDSNDKKNHKMGEMGSEPHGGMLLADNPGDLPKRLVGLLRERKMTLDALIQGAESTEIQSVRIHARKMRKYLRSARRLARLGDGEGACLELEKAQGEMQLATFAQSYNARVCDVAERGVYADTRAILLSRAYDAVSVYSTDKAQAAVDEARKYLHPKDAKEPEQVVQACEETVRLLKASLSSAIMSTVAQIVDAVALQQDARTNALVLIRDLRAKYALMTQNVDKQWVTDSEKDILLRAEADLDAARDLCTPADREELRMLRAQRAALVVYADLEGAIRQAWRLANAHIDNIVSLRIADGYMCEAVNLCADAAQNQAHMDPGGLGKAILVTSREKLSVIEEMLRQKRRALDKHHAAACLHVVVRQVEEQQEAEASLNLTQKVEDVLTKAQEEFTRARYTECLETITRAKSELERGFWRDQIAIFPRIIDLQDRAQVSVVCPQHVPFRVMFLFLYVYAVHPCAHSFTTRTFCSTEHVCVYVRHIYIHINIYIYIYIYIYCSTEHVCVYVRHIYIHINIYIYIYAYIYKHIHICRCYMACKRLPRRN